MEQNKVKRYSTSRKILILIVLIISSVMMAVSGSWIIPGLFNGMTWKEALITRPSYEHSRSAGAYLQEESEMILADAVEIKAITGTGGYQILPAERTNALLYMRNLDTGAVYTTVKDWGGYSLEEVKKNYLGSSYSAHQESACYYSFTTEDGAEAAGMPPEAQAFMNSDPAWNALALLAAEGSAEILQSDYPDNWEWFVGLNAGYPVKQSRAYQASVFYDAYQSMAPKLSILAFPFAGLAVLMLVLVGLQAGHNSEDREIHMNLLDRFPLELWILSDVILILIGLFFLAEGLGRLDNAGYYSSGFGFGIFDSGLIVTGTLILMLTIAKMLNLYLRRIKAKQLGGSLICSFGNGFIRAGRKVKRGIRTIYLSRKENQKLIIRFVIVAAVNILFSVIMTAAVSGYMPGIALIFFILLIAADLYLLWRLVTGNRGREEIRTALAAISQGDLDYQIDTEEMNAENRMMAEEVNRMRDGLRLAVETRLKSERLKTDLIANVSHDIRTPLTSIINYVDILKREKIGDEKISGYIDILDRKSARLKQLTDDLIEVSKISSGNVTLHMQEINLKQLIKQINGEYKEKFDARNLQLVCCLPEENMLVNADGPRMCRVIENLYNNAAKYAMPGSRIYVNGELREEEVVLSVKNMSEHSLNISADELMERFVRGDESRTTEGSGLGLEIARNLTVMQKGSFDLYLDGDLFKVTLVFPAAK